MFQRRQILWWLLHMFKLCQLCTTPMTVRLKCCLCFNLSVVKFTSDEQCTHYSCFYPPNLGDRNECHKSILTLKRVQFYNSGNHVHASIYTLGPNKQPTEQANYKLYSRAKNSFAVSECLSFCLFIHPSIYEYYAMTKISYSDIGHFISRKQ